METDFTVEKKEADDKIYFCKISKNFHPSCIRSGSSVVDDMLDYQSRDCKIDPPLLQSF